MAMNKQRKTSNLLNILSYDDAGNIVLRDYSQTIRYNWNGTIHAFTGPLSISSIAAAVTDTDRFLVSDGGVLKYRTGTEVLSDIGGVPSTRTLTINGVTQDLSVNRTFTIAAGITGTGADGQVAYWNGTSSQTGSNNLFWDNANARLGIGTNTPSTTLDIRGKTRIQSSGNAELDIIDGSNSLRLAMGSTQGFVGTLSSHPFGFFTGALKRGEFSTNGNFILQNGGTFTDGGQRLQVQGNVYVNGTYVGTNTVETTGTFYSRGSNSGFRFSDGASGIIDTGSSIQFRNYIVAPYQFTYQYGERTSGIRNIIEIPVNVNPTSGTAIYNMLVANPTINQTGGANGITRGLYVNPTLTAAADWRSIEWSNNSGWGLYGAGTANNYLGGNLGLGVTPSAWRSGDKVIDIGTTSSIVNAQGLETRIYQNSYVSSAGVNTYKTTAPAVFFGTSSGAFSWFNAPSGTAGNAISFTQAMTLTSGGNLLVGTTADQGYRVQITSASADSQLNVWGATAPSIRLDNAASGATQRFVIGLATATNNFIQGANAGDVCMTPGTSSALVFGMWQTSSSSEVMRISTSSNVLIGTSTDVGAKLRVVGDISASVDLRLTRTGTSPAIILDQTQLRLVNQTSGFGIGLNVEQDIIRFGGAIRTNPPAGSGNPEYKLGSYSATAPTATGYLNIEVGGVVYKVLAST